MRLSRHPRPTAVGVPQGVEPRAPAKKSIHHPPAPHPFSAPLPSRASGIETVPAAGRVRVAFAYIVIMRDA